WATQGSSFVERSVVRRGTCAAEAVSEGAAGHPQHARGRTGITTVTVDEGEQASVAGPRGSLEAEPSHRGVDVLRCEDGRRGPDRRRADHVAQLADVAWEGMGEQPRDSRLAELSCAHRALELTEEMRGERWD